MNSILLVAVLILAHLFGTFLIWKQARLTGWSEEKIIDLVLVTSFFALIVGRFLYGIENLGIFIPNPVRIFLVARYSGFSVWGAGMGAIVTLAIFARLSKLRVLAVLDLFILPVILAINLVLFSCLKISCEALEYSKLGYSLLGSGIAVFLLSKLRRSLYDSPSFAKVKRTRGLIFLLSALIIQLLVLLLVKDKNNGLYSFYKVWFGLELIVLVVWYHEVIRMIKLPSSVLGQIKDYLEKKRRDTEELLAQLRRDDPTRDADRLHQEASDDDTATVKAKHERTQALQLQLTKTLIEVKKALTKIKVGSYGICEVCGRFIDTDRLAANPQATLCLDDERKKEKKK